MISVSTKHALKALIALSSRSSEDFLRVPQLSKEIKVPSAYLSKVLKALAKAGLIESRKGPHGGVRIAALGRAASFFEVCVALADPAVRDVCFFSKLRCNSANPCPLHSEWLKTKNETVKFLKQCLIRRLAQT